MSSRSEGSVKKEDIIIGSERPASFWNVWRTSDELEQRCCCKKSRTTRALKKDETQQGSSSPENNDYATFLFYPNVTLKVVQILREWGNKWAGEPKWASLLNKSSFLHEVEESIVAIHYLIESISSTTTTKSSKIVVIDVCAGKGLFSFLLSYMKLSRVASIIMLEKECNINWNHIHEANQTHVEENRCPIEIWSNTDLHDYDKVLDRILALSHPVALSGIHLCKQLGPSFCGLVNGLGSKCIYACLSPCCMPRSITAQKYSNTEQEHNKNFKRPKKSLFTLSINLEEDSLARQERLDYMARRAKSRRKRYGPPCFHCQDVTHGIRQCSTLLSLSEKEQAPIWHQFQKSTVPCWNCLEFGHFKADCPQPQKYCSGSHPCRQPPTLKLDVSHVLASSRPYATYCHLLSSAFDTRSLTVVGTDPKDAGPGSTDGSQEQIKRKEKVRVIETPLQNVGNHQLGNWNSERKSIFIVVT